MYILPSFFEKDDKYYYLLLFYNYLSTHDIVVNPEMNDYKARQMLA